MAVRATVSRFPADADELDASGMLWGVAVTPFATKDENGSSPMYGSNGHLIPRCENCWAYYNTYCDQEQWAWTCSLCGTLNGLSTETIARYSLPNSAPENMSSFIDLELPLAGSEEDMQARPVYVAAVDLACSEEFIELTKSALLAALEALAPGSLFGLATFSHKLGLYDVQGPIPVIKNVFIPPDSDGTLPVELEDAMPLFSFLAPVETCKDRITNALETLRPTTSWERNTGAGQGLGGMLLGGRGFGLAMEALITYLASEYGNTFALGRIFGFLSGPPDYGPGQLDTRRYSEQYASKGEDADHALLPEQMPFYKDLASVAVQAGVCIDIFAVTNEYTDLASLKFLSIESGGSLFLYPSTDDSTLPQDMYRMLSRPYAFNCVMRLRTSSEFKPGNSYGHFFPDPQYENVQHVICCDSYATYAYDFEFANNTGFSRNALRFGSRKIPSFCKGYLGRLLNHNKPCTKSKCSLCGMNGVFYVFFSGGGGTNSFHRRSWLRLHRHTAEPPTLQLAFQYTVVVPPLEPSSSRSGLSSRSKYTLKRRLRIRTMQFGTANSINDIYDSADPETVLVILVHKVILVSLNEGVREGRMLLHDWLVILIAQYNDVCKTVRNEYVNSPSSLIDVTFAQCPQLQSLPRLIFALLRNPLLRFHGEGVHPDYRIYIQCLFSGLEPGFLQCAVYPMLTSYATPDKQAHPRHSLSRAALLTSGGPIFFLDAFTTLIVFYSSTADPTLPYPPPHDCLLRRTINKLKQERCITPRLMFIRGGQDDATPFENHLIEEQDVDGSGITGDMGFVSFLEEVNQSVLEYLK